MVEKGKWVINGKTISIFQEGNPAKINWVDAGAQCTMESISVFPAMEKAEAHLKSGALQRLFLSLLLMFPFF